MVPRTRYARSGEASIAYQVVGEGPIDMLFMPGWISHVEHQWESPPLARWLERLARFSRLVLFDRRGTGLSERVPDAPTLDEEVIDALAVLDTVESERCVILTMGFGGPTGVTLAARHPERVSALVLYASVARTAWAPDYDWALTREQRDAAIETMVELWGEAKPLELFAPSAAGDAALADWFARLERLAASPGTARVMSRATNDLDVRATLPDIVVPTLVLHRPRDPLWDVRHSRYLAAHIPGARMVELEGADDWPWLGDGAQVAAEIEEFVTGGRSGSEAERALLTVVFTDIVGATALAAELGDTRWRDLLASHDACVRRELERFGGREVKAIGDSFLAVFSGAPSRALRAAAAIVEAVRDLGIEVRVGVHTGECELLGDDVGGMAVHIGSRVCGLAGPSQVLVSGTAFGTVVGSGLRFSDLGFHELKGVSAPWPIFELHAAS